MLSLTFLLISQHPPSYPMKVFELHTLQRFVAELEPDTL